MPAKRGPAKRPANPAPVKAEIVTLLIEYTGTKPPSEWAWTTDDAPEPAASITPLGSVPASPRTTVTSADGLEVGAVFRDSNDRILVRLDASDLPLAGITDEGWSWLTLDHVAFPVEIITRLTDCTDIAYT